MYILIIIFIVMTICFPITTNIQISSLGGK